MRSDRLLAMIGLAVAAGLALIWVEGYNLRLKQKITELYHQRELLAQEHAQLRLQVSRLSAPAALIETARSIGRPFQEPQLPVCNQPRPPLPLLDMAEQPIAVVAHAGGSNDDRP